MNAPVPDEGPSLGELSRRVAEVLAKFEGLLRDLDLKYVNKEVYKAEKQHSDQRLGGLEDNLKWVVRTVLGLVITALIAGVIYYSGGAKP